MQQISTDRPLSTVLVLLAACFTLPAQAQEVAANNWYITEDGVVSQYAPGEKSDITNLDMWFDERYVHE